VAKILPRQTIPEQEINAARLSRRSGSIPIVPQSSFITPQDINRIYNTEDSDPFIYGVERYFTSLRKVTNTYMETLEDPDSLSLSGQRMLRRISNS
jgi:hypothetical protein